jgi:alkylation response protein AidB-like acyl-CoA dehydrogenase
MRLSPEQRQVQDTMRAFARDELAPHAARWDREHTFPREALRALGKLGALGIVVPERWGGANMD